jgi:hypothetical protein
MLLGEVGSRQHRRVDWNGIGQGDRMDRTRRDRVTLDPAAYDPAPSRPSTPATRS